MPAIRYSTDFIPVSLSTHQTVPEGPCQSQRKVGIIWESNLFFFAFNDI